jgi:hypothetical protein
LEQLRSKLYLQTTSPDARILKVVKANHGKVGEEIAIRWNNGVYDLDNGDDPVVERTVNSTVNKLFLELLTLFNAQEQAVSSKTGANYAPAKMALHPKAKDFNKRQLAACMQRLLDSERIGLVMEGSPSRQRQRLVVNESATVH